MMDISAASRTKAARTARLKVPKLKRDCSGGLTNRTFMAPQRDCRQDNQAIVADLVFAKRTPSESPLPRPCVYTSTVSNPFRVADSSDQPAQNTGHCTKNAPSRPRRLFA